MRMKNRCDLPLRYPVLLAIIIIVKRMRTKVGAVLVLLCLAESTYYRERPFGLDEPNVWVVFGIVLILVGLAFRIGSLGTIHKKERLATTGTYSLCRHPLYFGSMLITYGFCSLMGEWAKWFVATVYFGLFYTLTIAWEEVRLAQRYGNKYERYRNRVPLLLPFGVFRANGFDLALAMRHGGWALTACTVGLLGVVEFMAETLGKH